MAVVTQNPEAPSAFSSLINTIAHAASAMVRAASRQDQVESLQALSDEQLATRGLAREDIVRHVFHDRYYL